jgi:DNA end-binding protein Ku
VVTFQSHVFRNAAVAHLAFGHGLTDDANAGWLSALDLLTDGIFQTTPPNEYFDDIQDVKVTKDMLDLAKHIVETKSADFEPGKFEDRYENALVELLNQKRKGEPVRTAVKARDTGNVVNLMDALRKSLSTAGKSAPQPAKGRKPKKAASGQREMLMAISGKGEGKREAKAKGGEKEAKRPARQRKAG